MKKIDKREISLLLAVTAAVLAIGLAVVFRESTPDWAYYQSEFRGVIAENIGTADPDNLPSGVQQIWIDELKVVDRCLTCHQGVDWRGLDKIEQPWKSHPNPELLEIHPPQKYGCTPCHGGQGYAVTYDDAHGVAPHWNEPLLGKGIASEYDPRSPPPLYQIRCNFCHRYDRETKGMDYINHAKDLVRSKACKVCHVINGEGGKMGPDLTAEGDKSVEAFDFSNFSTELPSVFNWHMNHFQQPKMVVPATIMPEMNFSTKDAMALAMLVMSWRDNSALPLEYVPGLKLKDVRTEAEIEHERQLREGDGAFFVEHSCFICHSVKAFGIKSPTDKGPDLSLAPEDVRARFSRDLDDFIFEPTGTMKIIFESQIVLTDEQKFEAISKIRSAYAIILEERRKLAGK